MRQSCFLSAAPRADAFPPCDPSLPGMDSQTRTTTAQKRRQKTPQLFSFQFYAVEITAYVKLYFLQRNNTAR